MNMCGRGDKDVFAVADHAVGWGLTGRGELEAECEARAVFTSSLA